MKDLKRDDSVNLSLNEKTIKFVKDVFPEATSSMIRKITNQIREVLIDNKKIISKVS